ESTGVYCIPLFELLESRGFTVYLVNARHVKNVSGRKSDRVTGWEEHLFALKQAVSLYDAYAAELAECDRQLESMLAALARHSREPGKAKRRARAKNAPRFDMRTYLFQLCGVDLTQIDGIDVTTAF
ncbi:MAG: hypothetical protein ACREUD_09485, partial [Gammaproteobacteria bacterium]